MSQRCDLTDLLADQCAHCRGDDDRPAADLQITRRVTAVHESRCALDGRHPIAPGDPIGMAVDDGDTVGWVCSDCIAAVTR